MLSDGKHIKWTDNTECALVIEMYISSCMDKEQNIHRIKGGVTPRQDINHVRAVIVVRNFALLRRTLRLLAHESDLYLDCPSC